jgi:hypothetical protein
MDYFGWNEHPERIEKKADEEAEKAEKEMISGKNALKAMLAARKNA